MGKLNVLPRDRIIRILLSNGFQEVKASHGPHRKFKKFDEGGKCLHTTFVSHCPRIVPNIIRCIIRQSGKPEDEFY